MLQKDASIMLKEEVGESSLRLKKAKFGHKISDILPPYDSTFYLPEKGKFHLKSLETDISRNVVK